MKQDEGSPPPIPHLLTTEEKTKFQLTLRPCPGDEAARQVKCMAVMRVKKMKKKDQYFLKIAEYKESLKNLSLEQLRTRQSTGYLFKEAAVAIRELIEEKEINEN